MVGSINSWMDGCGEYIWMDEWVIHLFGFMDECYRWIDSWYG
jgi:hypothetical protein